MEVHPILGRGDSPNPGLWYVISSYGQYPSMRVGHTITFVPGRDGKPDKLVIIGGANPSGPFAETHILSLDKYEWDELECDGLIGRYEHCAFNPESQPDNIYIFGGADQAKNLNDVQMLNLASEKWSSISVSGTPPSHRTCRSSASIGNKLYVFGGGGEKSEPVTDRRLHVFDIGSLTWSQPEVKGKVPKPRLGHVMVGIGNKIYLHGGMARDIFYNELYELDIDTMTWKVLRCKGDVPQGCTAHAAVAISNTQFCIQGGMTSSGALDSTYVFDIVSCRWKKMNFEGSPPECRLDHAICLGYITTYPKNDATKQDNVSDEEHEDVRTHLSECESKKDRTSDGSKSKDTQSLTSGQEHTAIASEGEVKSSDEKVNVKEPDSVSKSNENVDENTDLKGVDTEAEAVKSMDKTSADATALASGLTIIEGSRQDPPLAGNTDVDTNVEALTSLLSIEGAKQIMSSGDSSSESGKACGECMQRCLVCVIHGGMDTGGEIFDDCLVWRVDGAPL
ncbi:rab9 effector protein with kelch motifs-like [Amphiura filiformis]|uniref:rab9 effector protein with kelch motifs-like n=1 Tax=Amphiura filiformis TaxID=82378 RepID=UPI003B227F69